VIYRETSTPNSRIAAVAPTKEQIVNPNMIRVYVIIGLSVKNVFIFFLDVFLSGGTVFSLFIVLLHTSKGRITRSNRFAIFFLN